MELSLGMLPKGVRGNIEIVECKGLGHPDTICDFLAEEVSLALSRYYLREFGQILHHNVDKVLLRGGQASAVFGGGQVTQPIDIYLAGRATDRFRERTIPVETIAVEACKSWLRGNMRALNADSDVRIHSLIRPGSVDLAELFARNRPESVALANDTSCGVGYAPLTDVENAVLDIAGVLATRGSERNRDMMGEDAKVMAVRRGEELSLTIACAHVSSHVPDMAAYLENKRMVAQEAQGLAERICSLKTQALVNTADGATADSVYLTVTGTSAEAGDDGEAGRGNRLNGLITPHRPMTMESVAGKNPVSHVGKLYNICASLIADTIIKEIPIVASAECYLVSKIGHPIDAPQIVDVRLAFHGGRRAAVPRADVGRIVDKHLAEIGGYAQRLVSGDMRIGRWPLQ
jgi:S-adenosylmethionine synthetase